MRAPLPQRWWHHADKRPALYETIRRVKRAIVISRVGNSISYAFIDTASVFAESLVVFANCGAGHISVLQGRIHEWWARFFASSMKDDVRYSPSDCFETFPFPFALLESAANDPAHDATRQNLDAIGERYHQFRAELMVSNNEGLTSTYNRFHDPAETSEGILELRRLHDAMDQAVLAAYGWSDALPPASGNTPNTSPCGFGLDYLDTEDDALLPPDLQERIASGDLFFPTATEACNLAGRQIFENPCNRMILRSLGG